MDYLKVLNELKLIIDQFYNPTYRHHGVGPLVIVRVGKAEHLRAVGHEYPAQELVHKVHLTDHVDKVQAVAQKVPVKYRNHKLNHL